MRVISSASLRQLPNEHEVGVEQSRLGEGSEPKDPVFDASLPKHSMSFARRLVDDWYTPRLTPLCALFVPLALLFRAASALRRRSYRIGILRTHSLGVPVVVVGNINVGGSGKTPLALCIARELASRGWRPGLVSRGYGGGGKAPRRVLPTSSPDDVGDEPVLLARSGLPVWVGRDRVAAGRALIAQHTGCNVVIADDGLQHYALARDVEIAAVDAARGFGNGLPLPAGPLREPLSRLRDVDAVVRLGHKPGRSSEREFDMALLGNRFARVNNSAVAAGADAFAGTGVHAVAGIGNPERFFAHLRALGIEPITRAFPDHHRYTPQDLALPGATAILMTEKDAVKCAAFADDRCWALPVAAIVDSSLITLVEEKLRGFKTS
jgi:tetraacyldisaccharide 4'-kinase